MNPVTAILGVYTCEKGSPGVPGSYYMKLTSKNVTGMGVVGALAFTGTMDVVAGTTYYGFACNSRPASLTGKWQFMAYGADQGGCMAALTKWNPTTMVPDTIAILGTAFQGMVMSWANFSLPFTYMSSETPDSAIIMFTASGDTPVALSYVYIDNLTLSGSVDIQEDFNDNKFSLSPNPASEKLSMTYHATETARVVISIFDINGKLVNEFYPGYSTAGENREVISLLGIAPGTYVVQLALGSKVTSDKLIVE